MSELQKTALHDWHREHGGRLVDFAGWSMPTQYTSIVTEHVATRTAAGIFDISHMGRLHLEGPQAAPFLDRVLSRRASNIAVGKVRYALVTNDEGGILDDVLVYHLARPAGDPFYALVVNASNREKILAWFNEHGGGESVVGLEDHTTRTVMIAVQGPSALKLADPLFDLSPSELRYYECAMTRYGDEACMVSRTGYTGEDGCEITISSECATELWQRLLTTTDGVTAQAVGLGARDTLRLEAGMPLYGHELNEQVTPFQAGLDFAVQLKDRNFIGREALIAAKDKVDVPRRVGLELAGRRIPREQYNVLCNEESIGEVTSGTFSPTLERPIAMAYVRPELSATGTELVVDIRGRSEPARVVPLPFYQRPRP